MRYEKPLVMDLDARTVEGQEPLSCYSGDQPGGWEYCGDGAGGSQFANPCITGHAAGGDPGLPVVCLAGPAATYCDAGAAGTGIGDDCTTGPSDAPG